MLIKYNLDDKGTGHVFERKELHVMENSKYQRIEISDVDILGRVLVLDNIIQLSELDCDRYHESFAHIQMACVAEPRRALILGGGDGILAKELLKYPGLVIDMVDIDERVCELSKEHLSSLHQNSFESERLNLYYQDALSFCEQCEELYDVIYADITDPHPNSPSASLLSDSAIETYKSLMNPDGIFVSQTDNIQIAPEHSAGVQKKLSEHFDMTGDYSIVALTLSSIFSFVWASDIVRVEPSKKYVECNWLNKKRAKFCFDLIDNALGQNK